MKQNIEIKDVQRTEYLDKNGLDMLWTKVKENTHNQVEVEYNRAKAKEDSLSQEIASVKPSEGKVFLQAEATEDAKILKDDLLSFGDYRTGVYAGAAAKGFFVQKDTEEVEVSSTGIKADVERESDTKVWNTNGGITDLTNYAKKTDIPEIDTSDFISKTTTDDQFINSNLYISQSDDSLHYAILSPEAIQVSTGELEGDDITGVKIASNGRNPYIVFADSANVGYTLKITSEGISNADNNANHVYATDGSIADLTQYAKKSEITTGGNVDDVQVNSVDTTAIGAGNYIPYNKATSAFYYLYNVGIVSQKEDGSNKTIQCPAFFEQSDENHSVTIRDGYINISNTQGNIMTLNNNDKDGGIVIYKHRTNSAKESLRILEDGIRLMGGDNNHVLTSNASTIDITQYVLKSVYDEKIAALEARIAALEAKHTETA